MKLENTSAFLVHGHIEADSRTVEKHKTYVTSVFQENDNVFLQVQNSQYEMYVIFYLKFFERSQCYNCILRKCHFVIARYGNV